MGDYSNALVAFVFLSGVAFAAFIGIMSARDEREQEKTH